MANPEKKSAKGANWEFVRKIRKARSEFVGKIMKDCKVVGINDRTVRNSLDHFDEWLDQEVADICFSPRELSSTMVSFNVGCSHWDAMQPRPHPIRVYIAHEKKFYNFGKSVDIGIIYEESKRILDKLMEIYPSSFSSEGPGFLLFHLARTYIPPEGDLVCEVASDLSTRVTLNIKS